MNVTPAIAYGVVGNCKTEASQKPVPVHPIQADALTLWRETCSYGKLEDWVFASRQHRGRKPLWGQAILRKYVRPAAERIGIQKRIGWHTFRHILHSLAKCRRRIQSHAGTDETFLPAFDTQRLHASSNPSQA